MLYYYVTPASRNIWVLRGENFGSAEFRWQHQFVAVILERNDKKWEPVFVAKSRDNKNLERTFDSIKCHPAPTVRLF